MAGELTAVAMSGGVDSSVAAALLAREGRPLVGFSMYLARRHEGGGGGEKARCCSLDDCQDARQVARSFGFPHHVLDMEEDFRRLVLDPFKADYARGRTPSPCVGCNTFLKFGALVGKAREVGASTVATGHYARLERDARSGRTLLRRAADEGKDQSYFLFDLSEEQRRAAEFPLGRMTKDEVREAARSLGLRVADKPESMDLCFLSRGESYRDFLERGGIAEASEPGEIVDVEGRALARHEGIAGFTVGQRRGLGVAAGRPLYVVRIDEESRRVVVGGSEDLLSDRCTIERVRWIPFDRPVGPVRATVKIRSTHSGAKATLDDLGDGTAVVRFDEPQRAVAPGQAAVAYDGDLVLGGGWIRT
ncbi:MAG: tRNA 2-thiouridine(34) synthase MnmA [Acidobacteriia bacterium]|nr:tRNA 2-thiouridine(34) synthase MnmA [Terriglobia bacterium]